MLGYPEGQVSYGLFYLFDDMDTYILDNVQCLGNESHISFCGHSGYGVADEFCSSFAEAGVICSGEGKIRTISIIHNYI